MTTTLDLLNIRLHIVTGETVSFLADTAPAVQIILDQVQREKVFASPNLIIADEMRVNAFPGSALLRIDLISDPLPWELLNMHRGETEPAQTMQISQDEWEKESTILRQTYPDRHAAMNREGERIKAYGRFTQTSGEHFHLRFEFNTPNINDQRRFLHNLSAIPVIPFRNDEGGITLLNTAKIVRSVFCPGAEPPLGSWQARERIVL